MTFVTEKEFESTLIKNLQKYGWDDKEGVLAYKIEQNLLDNWASILFENNRDIDRLNNVPSTIASLFFVDALFSGLPYLNRANFSSPIIYILKQYLM